MTKSHADGSITAKARKAGISRVVALLAFFAVAATAVFSLGSPTSLFDHLATGFSFGSANLFGSTVNAEPVAEVSLTTADGSDAQDSPAFITTDRTDYNPGETVIITGSGWDAHELVSIEIKREGVVAANYQTYANEFGNVYHREFAIQDGDIGVAFALRATGSNSNKTAEAKFTDGVLSYTFPQQLFTGASAVISGNSVVGIDFNQTVRSPNTNPNNFKASLSVTPNTISFGGNTTTPFPAGFDVRTTPGDLQFSQTNQNKSWNVRLEIPANTPPGFYTALIRAVPDTSSHTSGTGTQVVIEVKAPAPSDITAPTTTANAGLYINNSWTNQPVTLNLSAVDNVGGVGVKNITYTTSGPNGTTTNTVNGSTASIVVSIEGSTTITYFATDNADNTENPRDFFINIDKTKPIITLNGISPMNVTYGNTFADPKATATDNVAPLTAEVTGDGTVDTNTVGPYTLTYNYIDAAGNAADQVTRTVNVVPADQTITFGPLGNKTYGDADFTVSGSASSNLPVSFASNGSCTVTGNNVHISGAGSCTITASQAGDASYTAAPDVSQTFSIAKKGLTVTPDAQTITFGDSEPSYTFQYSGGFVGSDDAADIDTAPVCGVAGAHSDAGEYLITCSGGLDNDYSFTFGTAKLKINQAGQTINVPTAAPGTAAYGTSFGVVATGGGSGNPVVITTSGVCTGGGNGNASITMTSGTGICSVKYNQAGNNNYSTASEVVSNTTAEKANAVISVQGFSGPYDGNAHGAQGTAVGIENPDPVDLNSLLTLGETFTSVPGGDATWNFAGNANYKSASGTVAITITKADATCAILGHTGTYDGNAHGASGTCKGVKGETLSGLNLGSQFTNYPGGTATWAYTDSTGNYKNTGGEVAIVINKALVKATAGSDSVTYNGQTHTPSACVVSGAFIGALSCVNNPATVGPNAGTTSITPSVSGSDIANFDIDAENGSFIINQALVSVKADNQTKTYGQLNPEFTAVVTGAVEGGDPVNYTLSSTATRYSPVGEYDIVVNLGSNPNYSITPTNSKLTINKADAICTVTPYNVTYNGTEHIATGSCVGVQDEVLEGLDLSGTKHTVAGSFDDNWSFTDVTGNYNDQGPTNITNVVDKAKVTATAGGGSSVYDGQTRTPSNCAVAGIYKGDLTCTNEPSTVGPGANTYTVNPIVNGTGLSNFEITSVSGSYTIAKAETATTVTFGNEPYVYRGTAFAATAEVTGPAGLKQAVTPISYEGDCINVTIAGCKATAEYAGNENYKSSTGSTSIAIVKKALTVTASSHTVTFNDPVPTISPSFVGFVNNETATVIDTPPNCSTTYLVGSLIGEYPTECTGGLDNNYTFTTPYTKGKVTVLTACSAFNGFLAPIGGANAFQNLAGPGGSFNDTLRTFKLGSTIPFKFTATCFGNPLTPVTPGSGIHTLRAVKYGNETTPGEEVIAVATDAATTGNQFRFTDGQWHFNFNTKNLGNAGQGTWLFEATLFDGSKYTVWLGIKK